MPVQPKVQSHIYSCAAHTLTCIDCSRTFDKFTYKVRCATANPSKEVDLNKPQLLLRMVDPVVADQPAFLIAQETEMHPLISHCSVRTRA